MMKSKNNKFLITIFSPMLLLIASINISAEEVRVKKSQASFSVTDEGTDPELGKLVLKQVPDFNFGMIDEKLLSSGFKDKEALSDGAVIVRDTRFGNNNWVLTVSMGKFNNGEGTELKDASLSLFSTGTLGEELSGVITDKNNSTELVKSNGNRGLNEFIIKKDQARLSLLSNSMLNLKNKSKSFSTTLYWNLNSARPKVSGI